MFIIYNKYFKDIYINYNVIEFFKDIIFIISLINKFINNVLNIIKYFKKK